ncbi:hypothetical protein JQ557_07575 [Bradyrhizobium sp. U87765 SZCCT0131]|uniref:phosphopantetheine-binding protein n=1 Tax=unclassified Bradyrhizobium TaxID=2631580 RepID=UPI001BAC9A84|nr:MULTISPECIES: phosphopantetheine-binding protein [unclassified Bradyrhizobium]MBR1217843.1 hypothetical protein [Bradyrhizobium sp. U87765 SZCCT0131]MBR1261211.1 hypothetical protein [Bradyrhizobium sp. U87765 SZCCT0134]MBR1303341.1 hypothetical protein [Bradyrhizobium sp. U87765 SZCCT0110]MBR1318947.1 hypothetical protein [Bradyrhizobium sp. U87765 SZCCT0109]MBR1347272.1 hypothetical protein [Bradyrhizobium sp. U87765 SZCCT0048]
MNSFQQVVTQDLARLVSPPIEASAVDLDAELYGHYGLSSLNMVLLMTSVCDRTGTAMMHLTEEDIADLRTPRDIIALLAKINHVEA